MVEGIDLVQIIGNVGFPIVITIYLLHRFEKKIESLEYAVQTLANLVNNKMEE
jgi:hypothetical protein